MGVKKEFLLLLDKMLVRSIFFYYLFFECGLVECVCCVLGAIQLVRVWYDMDYG